MPSPPPPLESDLLAYSEFWKEKPIASNGLSEPAADPVAFDEPMFERFWSFCSEIPDCFFRAQHLGHCTGSAWITDPQGSSTLLLQHPFLNRWLQPGGHADGSADLWAVALREAHEETGLPLQELRPAGPLMLSSGYRSRPVPLDLDIHGIGVRGAEPAHQHFDLRFWFIADPSLPLQAEARGIELAWIPYSRLESYTTEESVLRLARKTRHLMLGADR